MQIDNYLFAVSKVKPVPIRDREGWRHYFDQWRSHVKEHLKQAFPPERADELFSSYETFAAGLSDEM